MSKLVPGRYRARILYHTMTENSARNPELRITVLPYSADGFLLPPSYKPSPITIFLTITDGTMGTPERPGWVLLTLKHLNFHSADLSTLDPKNEMAHSFTGHELTILGSEDEYLGKKRVRWNILRHEAESKPVQENALIALSLRYAAQLKTLLPKEPPTNLFGSGPPDRPPF